MWSWAGLDLVRLDLVRFNTLRFWHKSEMSRSYRVYVTRYMGQSVFFPFEHLKEVCVYAWPQSFMHRQSDKWQVSSKQKLIICARILLPGTDLPDMCSESRIQMEAWHVWIEMAMRIITYTHTQICVCVHICAHLYRGSLLRGLVKGRRDLNFSMQESVSEFLPFVVCNTGIRLQGHQHNVNQAQYWPRERIQRHTPTCFSVESYSTQRLGRKAPPVKILAVSYEVNERESNSIHRAIELVTILSLYLSITKTEGNRPDVNDNKRSGDCVLLHVWYVNYSYWIDDIEAKTTVCCI